ncbi:MAG: DUF4402 domain-containing protein [Alphaproteobacteria bacterium]|nr:DUF4402 domain-containing protein [Alphaproteobacteria bacterium]
MRKYFLTTAVALLCATTANATTDYAEVTAKATIEVAGTFECSDLDFGTIVVKSGRTENTIVSISDYNGEVFDKEHVLSISDWKSAICTGINNGTAGNASVPPSVELTGSNGTLYASLHYAHNSDSNYDDTGGFYYEIDASLTIPKDVKSGEYTGTFTITRTY